MVLFLENTFSLTKSPAALFFYLLNNWWVWILTKLLSWDVFHSRHCTKCVYKRTQLGGSIFSLMWTLTKQSSPAFYILWQLRREVLKNLNYCQMTKYFFPFWRLGTAHTWCIGLNICLFPCTCVLLLPPSLSFPVGNKWPFCNCILLSWFFDSVFVQCKFLLLGWYFSYKVK